MSGVQRPVWREGLQRVFNVPIPAAGQDFVFQLPEGPEAIWYRPKGVVARLVASGAAGNRNARLLFRTGPNGQTIGASGSNGIAAAGGSTTEIAWHELLPISGALAVAGAVIARYTLMMPFDFRMPAGFVIASETTNLDVADQWANIAVYAQELIYVPPVDAISGIPDALKALSDSQLRMEKALVTLAGVFGGAPT